LAEFLVQDEFGNAGSMIRSIAKYMLSLLIQAVGSPILGIVFSFLMGIAFKHGDFREHKLLELSLYILPMYVPFILSEVCCLSGMITIFFTGISAKRYMEPNVSDATKEHSKVIFRLFAFLAETCIFLELGLSVFGLSGSFQWKFIGFAFCAALLGRALSVYPLSLLYNLSLTKPVSCNGLLCGDTSIDTLQSIQDSIQKKVYSSNSSAGGSSWTSRRETPERKRDKTIPVNFMHMLWFVGLRGAVAYACACHFPDIYGHNDEFVAATMVIVLVTIIIMGGGTEPLMDHLKIRTGVDEKEYMRHWHAQRKLKGRFHQFGTYRIIHLPST
jgi:sodium/hydrogen exchanger 8